MHPWLIPLLQMSRKKPAMYVYFEIVTIEHYSKPVVICMHPKMYETFFKAADVIWEVKDNHIEWVKDRFTTEGYSNQRATTYHHAIETYLKDLIEMFGRVRLPF